MKIAYKFEVFIEILKLGTSNNKREPNTNMLLRYIKDHKYR